MKKGDISTNPLALFGVMSIAVVLALGLSVAAQDPPLQQSVAEVNQAVAENRQALAHYSWQQQETISLKGDVKDTKLFQVHVGPEGQPQKVELEDTSASASGGGRIKHRIVEKKKEEYQEYGERIRALAEQYARPDPTNLLQAFQQGNVMLDSASIPGEAKLMITNYVKPGDKVMLVFNRQARAIQSLEVASYLNDPTDAVTIQAQFSKLPDGTNHVAKMQVNGVSKNLLVTTENSNYQRIM